MKTTAWILMGMPLLICGTIASASQTTNASVPRVSIRFIEPEKFTDVGERRLTDATSRTGILDQLEKALRTTADRHLPEGWSLSVRITDVDMAGDFEAFQSASHVRIVTDAYPPRADLDFRLTDASGAVVAEGKRRLADPGYLFHVNMGADRDALRYDKALLTDWVQREIRRYRKR